MDIKMKCFHLLHKQEEYSALSSVIEIDMEDWSKPRNVLILKKKFLKHKKKEELNLMKLELFLILLK